LGKLGVALRTAPDVTGVDAVFGQALGAGRVLLKEAMTIEMEVADEGDIAARVEHALLLEVLTDEGVGTLIRSR